MKQRNAFWDNYTGLMIGLIVFSQLIVHWVAENPNGIASSLYGAISLFSMPAFIFCIGAWSSMHAGSEKRTAVKLLLVYLASNTFMMLGGYFIKGVPLRLFAPYAHNWLLLSILLWHLTAKYITRIKGILPVSLVAALLVGFWPETAGFLAVGRMIAFYCFFLMGYKLNKEKFRQFVENRSKYLMALAWVVCVMAAVGVILIVRRLSVTEAVVTMQTYSSFRDVLCRMLAIAVATVVIVALSFIVPNIRIPLWTNIGKNAFLIYVAHGYVSIAFAALLPAYSRVHLLLAAAAAAVTLIVFGLEPINRGFHKALSWLSDMVVDQPGKTGKVIASGLLIVTVLIGFIPVQKLLWNRMTDPAAAEPVDIRALTEDATVISFVGDLILLKEQVESAYNEQTDAYDFTAMFEYAAPYLQSADLSIGVMEGPFAGEEAGYSTSNADDGYRFVLNYPDSFASAIKDAGIDLVTTANNHITDVGVEGAYRTLDVLDEVGLQHTGSYRNQEEKDRLLMVSVDGIDIAVLSYTFWATGYTPEELYEQYPHLTSWIPYDDNPYYDELLIQVQTDFAAAKEAKADLIVVLPHMGTQFIHETDAMQKKWNKIYAELGADIILGDHPHAVQPIEEIGDTLVVNCPGNFVNSFIGYDGDACSIVEVYIDRQTMKPVATSVIPLYTQEMRKGYYRALPVYDVFSSKALYEQMPSRDLVRMEEVHSIVTEVMVGQAVSVQDIQPRYYWVNGAYQQLKHPIIEDYTQFSDKEVYKLFKAADRVVFLGESVTTGNNNQGHPWYEPLTGHFKHLKVTNISGDGYTTQMLTQNMAEEIGKTSADLYVIAIGANDVRFRDERTCAMTAEEYVSRIDELAAVISNANPKAKLLFIAPWMTLECDWAAQLPHPEKMAVTEAYTTALEEYTQRKGYAFVDPNAYLEPFFAEHHYKLYTSDGIHPNVEKGTELYSAAVILMSK